MSRRLVAPSIVSTCLAFALLCAATSAHANPGISGYSGKPNAGSTDICSTACHNGAGQAKPTLDITIPTTVTAGSTNQVTVVVNGTRARTSINASFSDGVVATEGDNTDTPFPVEAPGEISAQVPLKNGASGTYKFSFKAPAKNGTIMLWVAGMSANGSGTGGDGVTATTRTITVTGGGTGTDGGTDGGPVVTDGGSSGTSGASGGTSGASGGTSGTSGASGGTSGSSGGDDDDDGSSGGTSGRATPSDDAGGCAMSPHEGSASAAFAGLAVAAALTFLSRRRR